MTEVGTIFTVVVLAPLALSVSAPVISDILSLLRRRRTAIARTAEPRRLAYVVPAHNEELLIGDCVQSIIRLGTVQDCIVIADNCDDDTASIARSLGAVVLERTDSALRGKPFAIAWALEQMDLERYDAVCVVDADCVVDEMYASELSRVPDLKDVLAQPFIGVSNASDSLVTRLAALYSIANNKLAFGVKSRGGLNVPVGAGLCIGTALLKRRGGWTSYSICEDWELYAQLTSEGERTQYVPSAILLAQEAKGLRQGQTQRARWQMGKLQVARGYLGAIVRSSKIGAHAKLDAFGELTNAGPVLSVVAAATIGALAVILLPPGPAFAILCLASLAPIRQVGYVIAALLTVPNPSAYAAAFCYLPIYAAGRVAIAALSIVRSPGEKWIRATRHVTGVKGLDVRE